MGSRPTQALSRRHFALGLACGVALVSTTRLATAQVQGQAPLLRPFAGMQAHRDGVWTIFFSHDGREVYTAGSSDVVILWDALKGKPAAVLPPIKPREFGWSALDFPEGYGGAHSAARNSSTTRLAIGSKGRVLVFDIDSMKEVQHLSHGNAALIETLAFSRDDAQLATGSNDGTLRLWAVNSGRELRRMDHGQQVRTVSFSSDGKSLLCACYDGSARLWNVEDGKAIHVFSGHSKVVIAARRSPDQRTILTASWDGTAKVWSADGGKLLHTLEGHGDGLKNVLFSPSGGRALSLSDDKALLWDAATWKLVTELEHTRGIPGTPAFSPDGRRLVIATHRSHLFDAITGSKLADLDVESGGGNAAFSPDSKRVAIADMLFGAVKFWDVAGL